MFDLFIDNNLVEFFEDRADGLEKFDNLFRKRLQDMSEVLKVKYEIGTDFDYFYYNLG